MIMRMVEQEAPSVTPVASSVSDDKRQSKLTRSYNSAPAIIITPEDKSQTEDSESSHNSPSRQLTVPKPFHFHSTERAERAATIKQKKLMEEETAAKVKAALTVNAPVRPHITIPKPFHFLSDERASKSQSRDSSYDENEQKRKQLNSPSMDLTLAQSIEDLKKDLRGQTNGVVKHVQKQQRRSLTRPLSPNLLTSKLNKESSNTEANVQEKPRKAEFFSLAQSEQILRKNLRDVTPDSSTLSNWTEPHLTKPQSPHFHTLHYRELPKSSEELEAELMEKFRSKPFKALPMPKYTHDTVWEENKVIKKITQTQPFVFSSLDRALQKQLRACDDTYKLSEQLDLEECEKKFRALPKPKYLFQEIPTVENVSDSSMGHRKSTMGKGSNEKEQNQTKSLSVSVNDQNDQLNKSYSGILDKASHDSYSKASSCSSDAEISAINNSTRQRRHGQILHHDTGSLSTGSLSTVKSTPVSTSSRRASTQSLPSALPSTKKLLPQSWPHRSKLDQEKLSEAAKRAKPFALRSIARHEEFKRRQSEQRAKEEQERREKATFRARSWVPPLQPSLAKSLQGKKAAAKVAPTKISTITASTPLPSKTVQSTSAKSLEHPSHLSDSGDLFFLPFSEKRRSQFEKERENRKRFFEDLERRKEALFADKLIFERSQQKDALSQPQLSAPFIGCEAHLCALEDNEEFAHLRPKEQNGKTVCIEDDKNYLQHEFEIAKTTPKPSPLFDSFTDETAKTDTSPKSSQNCKIESDDHVFASSLMFKDDGSLLTSPADASSAKPSFIIEGATETKQTLLSDSHLIENGSILAKSDLETALFFDDLKQSMAKGPPIEHLQHSKLEFGIQNFTSSNFTDGVMLSTHTSVTTLEQPFDEIDTSVKKHLCVDANSVNKEPKVAEISSNPSLPSDDPMHSAQIRTDTVSTEKLQKYEVKVGLQVVADSPVSMDDVMLSVDTSAPSLVQSFDKIGDVVMAQQSLSIDFPTLTECSRNEPLLDLTNPGLVSENCTLLPDVVFDKNIKDSVKMPSLSTHLCSNFENVTSESLSMLNNPCIDCGVELEKFIANNTDEPKLITNTAEALNNSTIVKDFLPQSNSLSNFEINEGPCDSFSSILIAKNAELFKTFMRENTDCLPMNLQPQNLRLSASSSNKSYHFENELSTRSLELEVLINSNSINSTPNNNAENNYLNTETTKITDDQSSEDTAFVLTPSKNDTLAPHDVKKSCKMSEDNTTAVLSLLNHNSHSAKTKSIRSKELLLPNVCNVSLPTCHPALISVAENCFSDGSISTTLPITQVDKILCSDLPNKSPSDHKSNSSPVIVSADDPPSVLNERAICFDRCLLSSALSNNTILERKQPQSKYDALMTPELPKSEAPEGSVLHQVPSPATGNLLDEDFHDKLCSLCQDRNCISSSSVHSESDSESSEQSPCASYLGIISNDVKEGTNQELATNTIDTGAFPEAFEKYIWSNVIPSVTDTSMKATTFIKTNTFKQTDKIYFHSSIFLDPTKFLTKSSPLSTSFMPAISDVSQTFRDAHLMPLNKDTLRRAKYSKPLHAVDCSSSAVSTSTQTERISLFQDCDQPFGSKWIRVFLLLCIFRIGNVFLIQTYFDPDEFWQMLEPAYCEVFFDKAHCPGYTWEWKRRSPATASNVIEQSMLGPVRSYLSIVPTFLLYWVAKRFGVDSHWLVSRGPMFLNAVTVAAPTDLAVWYCAHWLQADISFPMTLPSWCLFCSLVSWFNGFSLVRTFSNSQETLLLMLAITLVSPEFLRNENKPHGLLRACLAFFIGGLSVSMRFSSVAAYFPIGEVLALRYKRPSARIGYLFLPCALFGVLGLLSATIVDRQFFGFVTLPFLGNFHFNVILDNARLYGTHPWHWYFTAGVPALSGLLLPFLVIGSIRFVLGGGSYGVRNLWIIVVTYLATMSFNVHKELRFLHPILPLCCLICGNNIRTLFVGKLGTGSRLRLKLLYIMFVVLNLLPLLYLGLIHQRGPIEVNRKIIELAKQAHKDASHPKTKFSIHYLTGACHSTPLLSSLHSPPLKFDTWALDCSPDCRSDPHRLCESEQFAHDPVDFMYVAYFACSVDKENQSCPANALPTQRPDFVVTFSVYTEKIRQQLEKMGLQEVARYPHHVNGAKVRNVVYGKNMFEQKSYRHLSIVDGLLEVSLEDVVLFSVHKN